MIIGQRYFDFSHQTYLMGILNVTPDSFSDGGRYLDPEKALEKALQLEEEGADIIDIGGESSRPGADSLSIEEEIKRILPVLKKIASRISIPISLDTTKSEVAAIGLQEGVSLINDISALRDPKMAPLLVKHDAPIILMHMRGIPKTMQQNTHYDNVIGEMKDYLLERIETGVQQSIAREKILIDPGIGFGKSFDDNIKILKTLPEFRKLGYPLVLGTSRKSLISKYFGKNDAQLLLGSVTSGLLGMMNGASLLRVHDVADTKSAIRLAKEMGFL